MKKQLILQAILIIMLCSFQIFAKGGEPVKFTILYDNYTYDSSMKDAWGFSCLIEGLEKTIIFDTGGKASVFMKNASVKNVDLTQIDALVISHNHWDHTGSVDEILAVNDSLELYLTDDVTNKDIASLKNTPKNVIKVTDPTAICPNVQSIGCLSASKLREQAIVINTELGLVLITGCSHPGIVNIVKQAKKITGREVYLVFGGMHLLRETKKNITGISDELKNLGVKKVGATHCTGDKAIKIFKKEFGDDFIEMGVGKSFTLEEIY